jgi:CoA-dependent NAD(P)H sulfur oxidoreductase
MSFSGRHRILIIGGGAAGMSAATSARRADQRCDIVVLERGAYVSSANCGIPYFISGLTKDIQELVVYTPDYFRKERDIEVRTHSFVQAIDHGIRQVRIWDLSTHSTYSLGYDSLIVATGARPRVPRLLHADAENVFTIRNLEDAIRLEAYISKSKVRSAAIIGGGWIGTIFCEAFTSHGIAVTIIEEKGQVLPGFDSEIAALAEHELHRRGVAIEKGSHVRELIRNPQGQVQRIITERCSFDTDLVLIAAGVAPATELLADLAGAGRAGALEIDDRMKTSIDGIYACGDCALAFNIVAQKSVYHPLGTTANRQGRVAGENAAGKYALFPGILGTQALKVYCNEMARTGLSSLEARSSGFKAVEALTISPSRARYVPGGSLITTKVIADGSTGRIIGAQMWGAEDVTKRVDVFVPMIHNRMTVTQALDLDISYTPQCSPLWDPILFCLRLAKRKLEESGA